MDRLDIELIQENTKKKYPFLLAILLSTVIFELVLSIRGFLFFDLGHIKHQMYLVCYLFLLLVSAESLVFLLLWRKREKYSRLLVAHNYMYTVCILVWAALVSCIDYTANGDSGVMVFVMIGLAIGAIMRIRPGWYILVMALCTAGMLAGILRYAERSVSGGFLINLLVYLILAWWTCLQSYHLGMRELKAKQTLVKLSATDQLTGLYNRRSLDAYLAQCCDAAQPVQVIMIDLDDFKKINDTIGHVAGDDYLILVAERLKDVFGEHCYRFGGDEFVVITALSADQAAARIGEVDQAISRAAQDTALHLSAGICSITEGSTPYEVLTHADKALYQAKKEGKACSTVY